MRRNPDEGKQWANPDAGIRWAKPERGRLACKPGTRASSVRTQKRGHRAKPRWGQTVNEPRWGHTVSEPRNEGDWRANPETRASGVQTQKRGRVVCAPVRGQIVRTHGWIMAIPAQRGWEQWGVLKRHRTTVMIWDGLLELILEDQYYNSHQPCELCCFIIYYFKYRREMLTGFKLVNSKVSIYKTN